jgi:hypothetical protein
MGTNAGVASWNSRGTSWTSPEGYQTYEFAWYIVNQWATTISVTTRSVLFFLVIVRAKNEVRISLPRCLAETVAFFVYLCLHELIGQEIVFCPADTNDCQGSVIGWYRSFGIYHNGRNGYRLVEFHDHNIPFSRKLSRIQQSLPFGANVLFTNNNLYSALGYFCALDSAYNRSFGIGLSAVGSRQ